MSSCGNERRFILKDEAATEKLGRELARLARHTRAGFTVFLDGELGMGKTTLSRGVMRALGHEGAVKSPTYTLVEPYENLEPPVYHFDLYRLGDPEELEYMGIRDYFTRQSIRIVEWPERGYGLLPEPDLEIHLKREGQGRLVRLRAHSELGASLLKELELIGPDS